MLSLKPLLFIVFVITGTSTLKAQNNDSLLQRRVRSQQYVFVPQLASSSTMSVPLINVDYRVRVETDSVIVDLPYNGKHFSVQRGATDLEIKFISTNFDHKAVEKKKGKWEMVIEPKDSKGVRLLIVMYRDGTAQMDVTSPSNETMTYKGYIY